MPKHRSSKRQRPRPRQRDASDDRCHGPTEGPLGDARIARNRTIRNLYVTATKEQIAAALEQRSFRTAKIVLPSVIAVLVNLIGISR
jgi:hypothetical protein